MNTNGVDINIGNGQSVDINVGDSKKVDIKLGEVRMYRGPRGYSNYELAVQSGYEGTLEEYLESLHGKDGKDAKINGENTLEIVEGNNISITQEDGILRIDNTYEFDDSDLERQIGQVNELAEDNQKNITNLGHRVENVETDKVDKVTGKSLIDDTEIARLKNVKNYDDTKVKQDITNLQNTKQPIGDYALKNEIPDVSQFITKSVNDLVNYYKKSETYTQSEVNSLIGAVKTISMKVVPERPAIGQDNIIYLVPSSKQTKENIYEEWIYVDNKWEMIGSTQVDLSNYYTIQQINTILYDYITSNDLEDTLKDYATLSQLPTKTSDLTNDSNYISDANYVHTDNNYTNDDKSKVDNSAPQSEITRLDNKISEIELTKTPDVYIHGTPTIDQGQVNNFSTENYLSLPAIFDLHDRGFEFQFAFKTNSDVTTAQNIIGSKFCMALFIQNSKINLRVSQNGTNWDLVDIQGNIDIQPNTNYYVKIYFDKLTYKLKYSLDGQTFTDIASKVASVSPHPAQIYIGVDNNFFNPFKGIINLNKCYLKINNSIIWTGLDDAGLQTRADIDLSNISSAGEEKIKEVSGAESIREDLGYFTNVTEDLHKEIGNTISSGRCSGNVGEQITLSTTIIFTKYYVNVEKGYICNLKYRVSSGGNFVYFVDENDIIIQIADENETYTTGEVVEKTFIAPTGAKKLYISNNSSMSVFNNDPNTNYGLSVTYKEVAKETIDKLKSLFGEFKPLDLSIYSNNDGGLNPHGTDEQEPLEDGAYQVKGIGKLDFVVDNYNFVKGDLIFVAEGATIVTFLSGVRGAGYFEWNSNTDTYEGGYYTTISDVDYEIQLLTQKQINYRSTRLTSLTVNNNYEYRRGYGTGSTAVKLTPHADIKDLGNNDRAEFNIWFNTHATTPCTFTWNDTSEVMYIINGFKQNEFNPKLNTKYNIEANWKGTYWLFDIVGDSAVQTIDENSTHNDIPTAKAVYDLINSTITGALEASY